MAAREGNSKNRKKERRRKEGRGTTGERERERERQVEREEGTWKEETVLEEGEEEEKIGRRHQVEGRLSPCVWEWECACVCVEGRKRLRFRYPTHADLTEWRTGGLRGERTVPCPVDNKKKRKEPITVLTPRVPNIRNSESRRNGSFFLIILFIFIFIHHRSHYLLLLLLNISGPLSSPLLFFPVWTRFSLTKKSLDSSAIHILLLLLLLFLHDTILFFSYSCGCLCLPPPALSVCENGKIRQIKKVPLISFNSEPRQSFDFRITTAPKLVSYFKLAYLLVAVRRPSYCTTSCGLLSLQIVRLN